MGHPVADAARQVRIEGFTHQRILQTLGVDPACRSMQGQQRDLVPDCAVDLCRPTDEEHFFLPIYQADVGVGQVWMGEQENIAKGLIKALSQGGDHPDTLGIALKRCLECKLQVCLIFIFGILAHFHTHSAKPFHIFWLGRVKVTDDQVRGQSQPRQVAQSAIHCDQEINPGYLAAVEFIKKHPSFFGEGVGYGAISSLRRHYPDQVLRVEDGSPPLSLTGRLPVQLSLCIYPLSYHKRMVCVNLGLCAPVGWTIGKSAKFFL